ncbi:MAG TPA: 50S ribosomal protein L18 [Pirellulales bacterium]|jgi:large subunit ribosomal protein L18|nr:50S ribosomal protein L18 [Pirellulales bacterium]
MNHEKQIGLQRRRRSFRVRKNTRGTKDRPRLCIVRSLKHTYAQVIDDSKGSTLASAATTEKVLKGQVKYGGNKAAAEAIGRTIAERALAAGIKQVSFDRGSAKYHGRVAALAESARKAGLSF